MLEIETFVNDAISGKPVIIVCMYNLEQVGSDSRVNKLIKSHTHLLKNNKLLNLEEALSRENINEGNLLKEVVLS